MFVGILMRALARDFCVEFESSRHCAILEISSRTVEKLWGATLNYSNYDVAFVAIQLTENTFGKLTSQLQT